MPPLALIAALVPVIGQLAALLVVRPARIGGGRLVVWMPVLGLILLVGQRAIPRARRVAAVAAALAGSYAAVALLALAGLLVRGETVATLPAVKAVRAGAPAAGVLEAGDRLERAQGVSLDLGRPSLAEHVERSQGGPVTIDLVRRGEARTVELTPAVDDGGRYRIGVELEYVDRREHVRFARAARSAFVVPARRASDLIGALWRVTAGSEEATFMGPVGIRTMVERSDDRRFDVALLLAIYALVLLLPLDLSLVAIALFTRDKVAA